MLSLLSFAGQMGRTGGHRAVGEMHTQQQPSGACVRACVRAVHVLAFLAAGTRSR